MTIANGFAGVPGAQGLHDFFGYWPTFHDAEIIRLHLNRSGDSFLALHTWESTTDVDDRGYYVNRKHVVVEFVFRGITRLELTGFSHQNVVFGLKVERSDTKVLMHLLPSYGLSGAIEAETISIRLHPGTP